MIDMESLFTMQAMMFLMILAGAVLRKINMITLPVHKSMTDIIINLILPCNILHAFSGSDSSALKSLLAVVIMGFLIQLILYFISKFMWTERPRDRRSVIRYAFQFSNCGFLGNPIIEGLYGAQGLIYASVYLIPIRIFMWTVGISCFTGSAGKGAFKKTVTHPCIIATAVGVLWMFFPVEIPSFMMDTIDGFNSCLTPFTMLVIGSILAGADLKQMFCKDIYVISGLRLIVIPFVTLVICRMMNLETMVASVVTVLVAMPVASTTAILASKYESDATFASNAVVFTTVLSLVTIPMFSTIVNFVF